MNELDYKSLLTVYQQKTSDMLIQNIALESKVLTANQIIDALNKRLIELGEENENLINLNSTSKAKRPSSSTSDKTDSWEE